MKTTNPPAKKGRLTVVETVYYQPSFGAAGSFTARYSLPVSEDEQRYERSCHVTQEWSAVDKGWVEVPGMVIIGNDKPSRKDPSGSWVQVGIVSGESVVPCWEVPPGGYHQGFPIDASLLRFRRVEGSGRCTVTVFPK